MKSALVRTTALRASAPRRAMMVAAGLCLALVARGATAATFVLDAQDSGWYDDGGGHSISNKNYLAGYRGAEYRDYFVFDLTALPPLPSITSATLRLEQPADGYASDDATETFELVDVITPAPALEAEGIMAITIYQDLGEGTVYGTLDVSASTNGTLVDVPLNAAGIAAVQGGVGLFAIGGHVTTLTPAFDDLETTWGFTSATSLRQLIVVTADPTTTTTTTSTSSTGSLPTSTSTSSTATTSSTTTTTLLACGSGPRNGCQAALSRRGRLQLGNGKLRWKWTSSATVGVDDFGSPQTATDYLFCIYEPSATKLSARAPAGGTCGSRPCWRAIGTRGFKYADRDGTPDGLTQIRLAAGAPGRGRIQVRGASSNIALAAPVRVQLLRSGDDVCWEATYSTAIRSDATHFNAKSD